MRERLNAKATPPRPRTFDPEQSTGASVGVSAPRRRAHRQAVQGAYAEPAWTWGFPCCDWHSRHADRCTKKPRLRGAWSFVEANAQTLNRKCSTSPSLTT